MYIPDTPGVNPGKDLRIAAGLRGEKSMRLAKIAEWFFNYVFRD